MRFSLLTVPLMCFWTACAVGDTSRGHQCGNLICEAGEANATCSTDCYCGNGSCDNDENAVACPQDCSGPVCGDLTCDPGESNTMATLGSGV